MGTNRERPTLVRDLGIKKSHGGVEVGDIQKKNY